MSDVVANSTGDHSALVLTIEDRTPVSLSIIAKLLVELARDYRGTTGHELFLRELRQGTITAILNDLSTYADQANHLYDFAKHVAALATAAVAGVAIGRTRRRAGVKSVLALADVVRSAGGEVQIVYRSRSGDELMVRITPEQGTRIQQASELLPDSPRTRLADNEIERIESLAKRVAVRPPDIPDAPPSEMMLLLKELTAVIRGQPEGHRKLAEVLRRLRAQGHHAAANLLER